MLRFEEAISAYDEVASDNWHATFNKGNALMCLGRFSEAQKCYIQALAQAPSDEPVKQNLWTSSRLLEMLAGLKFTACLDPSGTHLGICIAERDSVPELHQYTYIIAGRIGNVGNSGYMNPGGHGFSGRGPITVSISSLVAEQG